MPSKKKRLTAASSTAPDVNKQLEKQKDELTIKPKAKLLPFKKKIFTLRHTVENVQSIAEGASQTSNIQEFFGRDWRIHIERRDGFMVLKLFCRKDEYGQKWYIATNNTYRLLVSHGNSITSSANGFYGNTYENIVRGNCGVKFLKWGQVLEAAVNDEVSLEVDVIITRTTRIGKQEPRRFDESNKKFSDVCLTVDGEDFYVLKQFLASRSSYFNLMFFSKYEEAGKDRIDLPGIDASDFLIFLDAVYGEGEIEDSTVECTLFLAEMFISPYVLNVCEKFLLKDSKMTSEKKFDLAKKYQLNKLTDQCISTMTIEAVENALNGEGVSMAISKKLPERLIVLHKRLNAKGAPNL